MNRFKNTLFAALLVAAIFLMTPLAIGQTITTGDVVGVITDTSGAVVPGATVTLKSVDTGETRTDTANSQGQYRFALLKPGDYIISASTSGLKSNNTRVTLLVGQEQATNLTMNPQGTSTIIEVTSETPIVQTENANLETNYNQAQVVNLPMAGGDLTTLAMTVPGIRVNVTGGSSNMNANGIPGASILYTLNGMDQNDPANNINNSGASNNLLGANSVAEVAVVLNAYGAEYGRMAGGQVNMIGFSGTNQFHGNVFYNFNWEDLNANSFFANRTGTPRPRSDAHQFGGRIGGPVLKNKVFFFFDDENLRYVLPGQTVVSLPSPQLETYTLAHVPAASLPLYQDYFNLINGSPGINRAVPVTNGSGSLQDGKNHLGCGTGTFTGTSDGSLGTFGVNVPCAVAFGNNANELNTERQYTIRADYNSTNNQKFFFRVESDAGVQATGVSPINPLYNSTSNQPSWQGNMNYSWVITPTLVNNVNASVLWYTALFGLANFAKSETVMPEAIAITDGGANGSTGFTPVGGGAYPNGFPVGRNVGHGQLNDDLSWTHGRHTIRAGIDFRYDRYTNSQIAQNAFLGRYSLNDLADFANGTLNSSGTNLGSSFAQTYPVYGAVHFRIPALDLYVSDEWAVSKNLKVTFGLRMEKDLNPSCVEDCFVLTNVPFTSSSYQGGVTVPYSATLKTNSSLFYNAEAPIWQPRFGVAYKPFHSDKTVIRGGIGLFSTNYTDGLAATLADQTPNSFTPSGLTTGNIGLAGDPTSSAFTAQQSAAAFFNGFKAGDTLAQIKTAVAPATFSTPSLSAFPNTFLAPHDIEWNFEIQQAINAHNLFSINYVGNHGYDLQETVNANAYITAAGLAMYPAGYAGLPTAAADARFVNVTQYYNNGRSNFDGLTIQYRHTFSYGLNAQIHYTWSHSLGTTTAYENPFNLNNSYGNLGFDNRHQMAADFLWAQPFKLQNKVANQVIAGWILSSKVYLYSGAPFSVTDSKIGPQINSAQSLISPLADVLSPSTIGSNCGRVAVNAPCLSTSEFATYKSSSGVGTPIQTDFGNVAPFSFYGPGYFDIDAQLSRDIRIKERMVLNFGIQAYNVLNHANFANPSGSLSSSSFGLITTTLGPPTSIYGTGQGAAVSGRLAVLTGRFTF
jgi:hypothetical protein